MPWFQQNALALVIGLMIDALIGDPENWPHSVRFIGQWIHLYEQRLRARGGDLRKAAVKLTAITVLGTMLVTQVMAYGFEMIHPYISFTFRCLIAWQCVSARCLAKEGQGVVLALRKSLDAGRRQVARIVGRDTSELTRDDILRATIETIAENTTDGVIAPMMFFFFGGPAWAMGFKASSTLDSMVGYLDERYKDIGWTSAKLDDILCFLPARLCGLLICCSATIAGKDGKNAFRIMFRDHKKHLSPNCAWSEAAAAGALHIQLGGAHRYFGRWIFKPFIGDDERPPQESDVSATIIFMVISEFLLMATFSLLSLAVLSQWV